MTLSESDITAALATDELAIERPAGPLRIEPSSVDLHLGDDLLKPLGQRDPIDVTDPQTYPRHCTLDEPVIGRRGFVLATTEETVTLGSSLVGVLHGRSSVGRLGLFVENAGLIDAGFRGQITLELFNASAAPIRLEPGMRIAQLTVHRHESAPETAYSAQPDSKYVEQAGPTPSRLYEDFLQADD